MKREYHSIPCFDFEYSEKKLSALPIGSRLDILSLPDIDDEVWTEAYVDRIEENMWVLTDVTCKLIEKSDIHESIFKQMSLEMNTSEGYEIVINDTNYQIVIREDIDFKSVHHLWKIVREDFYEYYNAITNRRLVYKTKQKIQSLLPVYERAKNLIILELTSFSKEVNVNQCCIINIDGRVKEIGSIEEKIYRKAILSSQVFDKFDDIAGVRVVCEYISDVYFLLDYIKENPLIQIVEIDDKIENPTQEGYRGIHIIVEVDVYYKKQLYEDVKVEIQLRTSFQNGWAMKTHKLTYKRKGELSQEIANQMKILSASLYEADSKAQELRNLIDTSKQ